MRRRTITRTNSCSVRSQRCEDGGARPVTVDGVLSCMPFAENMSHDCVTLRPLECAGSQDAGACILFDC